MSARRLVDTTRLALQRRPSLFVADALDVHRSHTEGRIHTRFAEFDRRCEAWHALRELVLSTHVLDEEEERVFDVLFFFGPMPRKRVLAWARASAAPPWAAPWPERAAEDYVEIAPRALPTMRAQLPTFRPTPEALRAALDALAAGLLRHERSRALGAMFTMPVDAWLRLLQTTLAGEPDRRSARAEIHLSITAAEQMRALMGPAHIDVARWLRAVAARDRSWTHWVPLARMSLADARAHVLTKHMDDATMRRLYGLPPAPPPLPEPPPRRVTSRRAARASPEHLETSSPSGSRQRPSREASPTPSTRESPSSRPRPRSRRAI